MQILQETEPDPSNTVLCAVNIKLDKENNQEEALKTETLKPDENLNPHPVQIWPNIGYVKQAVIQEGDKKPSDIAPVAPLIIPNLETDVVERRDDEDHNDDACESSVCTKEEFEAHPKVHNVKYVEYVKSQTDGMLVIVVTCAQCKRTFNKVKLRKYALKNRIGCETCERMVCSEAEIELRNKALEKTVIFSQQQNITTTRVMDPKQIMINASGSSGNNASKKIKKDANAARDVDTGPTIVKVQSLSVAPSQAQTWIVPVTPLQIVRQNWQAGKLLKSEHICAVCRKEFPNLQMLQAHQDLSHFQCKKCEKWFNTTKGLQKHQEEISHFQCEKCEKWFNTTKALRNHQHQGHLKCKVCDIFFCSKDEMTTHQDRTHTEVTCGHCQRTFNKVQLRQRVLQAGVGCDACESLVCTKEELEARTKVEQCNDEDHDDDACESLVRTEEKLEVRSKVRQGDVKSHTDGMPVIDRCAQCKRTFNKVRLRKGVLKARIGCETCERMVCSEAEIEARNKALDTRVKSKSDLTCEQCERTFDKVQLKRLILEEDADVGCYSCERLVCSRAELEVRNIARTKGEKQLLVTCQKCWHTFNKAQLRKCVLGAGVNCDACERLVCTEAELDARNKAGKINVRETDVEMESDLEGVMHVSDTDVDLDLEVQEHSMNQVIMDVLSEVIDDSSTMPGYDETVQPDPNDLEQSVSGPLKIPDENFTQSSGNEITSEVPLIKVITEGPLSNLGKKRRVGFVKCDYCSQVFDKGGHLNAHQYKTRECDVCKEKICNKVKYRHHMQEAHNYMLCVGCNEMFDWKTDLDEHSGESSGQVLPKCNVCGMKFHTQEKLRIHAMKHQFECDKCLCKFKSEKKLKRHVSTKHVTFDCDICGKVLCDKHSLTKHKKFKHSTEGRVTCDVCGNICRDIDCLEQHRIAEHGVKGRHKCEVCGKQYWDKTRFNIHKQSHCGEKPYKCSTCGKSYSHRNTLYIHRKTHTNERKFKCTVCDASFITKYILKTHMNKHDLNKTIQCTTCGKKFRSRDGLKVHLEAHMNQIK